MIKFNIDLFKNISENDIEKSLNDIFSKILCEIGSYLNLKPINSNVKFIYNKSESDAISKKQNVFDLGTNKYFINDTLCIDIFREYEEFLPFILLREVYNCFVPINLRKNDAVNTFINQIVENDLLKLNEIKKWKSLIRSKIVDVNFLLSYFVKSEKFLELKGFENTESTVNLFFMYVRRNFLTIDNREPDLYDKIFKEFVFNTTDSLKNDELVETIRILIEIFYRVKSYRALLEYQDYFKEFKKNGTIQTELSLNRFVANVRWINAFSYIGPSYQSNYKAVDLALILCNIQFNPLLTKAKIDHVIEKFPFFMESKYSLHSFAVEVSGWFVLPRIYLKDLQILFQNLKQCGYIINVMLLDLDFDENNLNLNYFREFYKKGQIINQDHVKYDKKYEIKFELNYGKHFHNPELSVLEFLILDRVRNWSITGFGFQRREETLRTLKSDLLNEIMSQSIEITGLKKNLNIFHENQNYKNSILKFIEEHQKNGFFYAKEFLDDLITSINLMEKFLVENRNINKIYQIQDLINIHGVTQILEDNLLLNNKNVRQIIFRELIPLYFRDETKYKEDILRYRTFNSLFKLCEDLKIFDFNSIKKILQDKTIIDKIYFKKENKLKKIYKSRKIKNITINDVNNILDEFSNKNPPIIKPILINTIATKEFAPFYYQIVIKDVPEIHENITKLKTYFPRFVAHNGIDLITGDNLVCVDVHLPNINGKEKNLLISILYNLFKNNLVTVKNYFWDGFRKAFSRKDFYNFETKEFFYTQDLFQQFYFYAQNIFGKEHIYVQNSNKTSYDQFLLDEGNIKNFIETIQQRTLKDNFYPDLDSIKELLNLYSNLKNVLVDTKQFKMIKEDNIFKKYIKSIKFKPSFQSFGFGKYYLFVQFIDSNIIDFKLLLTNTFLSVKRLACLDKSNTFFIKYIFPYKNPNKSYLNWLSQSKKNICEYCLFLLKKVYPLFQLDINVGPNGWDMDSNRFKNYIQKVLFDPDYNIQVPRAIGFSIGELPISKIYEPESKYFEYLTKIYRRKALDIKSVLSSKNSELMEVITELIRNNLIFPYIKPKNLDLIDKMLILLPNLNNESINKILQVCNFFNFGFIYEIEGEYYIHDDTPKIKKFEHGLLIKLYLPSSVDFSDFFTIFNKLFQYLKIKKFLIWHDLIDDNNIIKSTFENLQFLERYQPLKNLIWNKNDKIWANHKLFNEKFETFYPNLVNEEKNNNS